MVEEVTDLRQKNITEREEDHNVGEAGDIYSVIQCAFCGLQNRVDMDAEDSFQEYQAMGWRYAGSQYWQLEGTACPDCANKIAAGKPEDIEENRSMLGDVAL